MRLAYTIRKSRGAMLVTSLTTAASFLATCISPIMMMISFGIFAATLVTINFALIIIVMPCVYIFYENHVKTLCCKSKTSSEEEESCSSPLMIQDEGGEAHMINFEELDEMDPKLFRIEDKSWASTFFTNKLSPFVFKYKKCIIIFFTITRSLARIIDICSTHCLSSNHSSYQE